MKISNDEKTPLPEAAMPKVNFEDALYAPVRGIRFVLQQMNDFFSSCDSLDLPVNTPVSFFHGLYCLLSSEDHKSSQIEGNLVGINTQNQVLYIALLLICASIGNKLFELNSQEVKQLLSCPDQPALETCIKDHVLEDFFITIFKHQSQSNIFTLYPELTHLEEMNREFYKLKDSPDIQTVPDDKINEPPEEWVHKLFDLFLDYYRQNESIVDDKQGNPSIEMQRQRLYAALELRDLSDRFQDDNCSSSDEVQIKTTLKSYIHDLINLMMQYPHLRNCNKNFKEFWKQLEENANDSHFSERMKSHKAKISALLLIHEDIRLYQGKMENIVSFFETILQSYRDERLYRFFLNLYQSITQYPILQKLAPVYVW